LFSGILGIEIGLERAGFRTACALDLDKEAQAVATANGDRLGTFRYLCGDINDLSPEELLDAAGLRSGQVAILSGGPPCQPFSKSGHRKGVDDDRGLLFKRYLEYLAAIRPQSFILENVRGLYSSGAGKDFGLILSEFDASGYTVYWALVDAANHGVPQFRQRLFLVGFRDRIRFRFPLPTHGPPHEIASTLFDSREPFVTAGEAVADLDGRVNPPEYSGQFAHLLAEIPPGLNYSHYTAKRGHPAPLFGWRSKYWYFLCKAHPERPALTIQAYPGNNTGPFHWDSRRFAIEELRRIQTLPDWLDIDKPYFVAHRLLGNAVPPLLAEQIGIAVRAALEASESISQAEYIALRAAARGTLKSGSGAGKGRAELALA
jgi:DNA (cytosine-5)-methyltransferase 1